MDRIKNPFYSEIQSIVLHDPQGFRVPEDDELEKKTKIPVSKFKQTVEKVKERIPNKPPRQSSIPQLKEKQPETKQPKVDPKPDKPKVETTITIPTEDKPDIDAKNDSTNVQKYTKENGDKNIKNSNIPLFVKKKVEKFRQKRDAKKGDANTIKIIERGNNVDGYEVKTNDNIDITDGELGNKMHEQFQLDSNVDQYNNCKEDMTGISTEEQLVIDDFDKIYEDVDDSEEPDSIIDEIVEKIYVDPEKLETKFEKIVHDYDKNIIQPISVEKTKSKIPLLKQKSLHDLPVAKIAERRSSLKNITLNDNNSLETRHILNKDDKETTTIDNKAHQNTNNNNAEDTKYFEKNNQLKTPDEKPPNKSLGKKDDKLKITDLKPTNKSLVDKEYKTANLPNSPKDIKDIQNKAYKTRDPKPNVIKETNKQTVINEEIKTANNLETVLYDDNVQVTEEIKLVKEQNKPGDIVPEGKHVNEHVKEPLPGLDKTNTDNNIKVVDANAIKDISNIAAPITDSIKQVENKNQFPNVIKVDHSDKNKDVKRDDNIVKEVVKVVTPVFDKVKPVDDVKNNNKIVKETEVLQELVSDKINKSYTLPKDKEPQIIDVNPINMDHKKVVKVDKKLIEEIKNASPIHEKPKANDHVKTINNTTPVPNKKNIVEDAKIINIDNRQAENIDNKRVQESVKNTAPMHNKPKTIDAIKSVHNDNVKSEFEKNKIDNEDKLQDKFAKDTCKVTPIYEDIKTPSNIETINLGNNAVVTEEIKLPYVDKTPNKENDSIQKERAEPIQMKEKDPKILAQAKHIKNDINDDTTISDTKEIEMKTPVFEEIKTVDIIETVECNNNQIVEEEIKFIKPTEGNGNFKKEDDTSKVPDISKHKSDDQSKMPDSTKMVQNLLSQMGGKSKENIENPSQNKNGVKAKRDNDNKHISNKDDSHEISKETANVTDKPEKKATAVSTDKPESIIHKLINKMKTREVVKNVQETPDDMPRKSSVKSKIAVFNKDKSKPAPIFKKQEDDLDKIPTEKKYEINEELNIDVVDKKDDARPILLSNNKNDYLDKSKDIILVGNNVYQDNSQKDPKFYTDFHKNEISNNREINGQKDFENLKKYNHHKPIENIDKNIKHGKKNDNLDENINNKSTESLDIKLGADDDDDYDLENEIDNYIPLGKVSSIINKIGSNDHKEIAKPESIIELPKKLSVSSKIAMFERQISKEPPSPKPQVTIKCKEITSLDLKPTLIDDIKPELVKSTLKPKIDDVKSKDESKPKIVNEIEKIQDKENLRKPDVTRHIYLNNKSTITNKSAIDLEREIKDRLNSKEYEIKPKRNTSSIIAKFERSIENQNINVKNINKRNEIEKDLKEKVSIEVKEPDFKQRDNNHKKIEDKNYANTKNDVSKEINNNKNIENRKKLEKSPSITEIDLGNAVKGKVKQIIVRINSKENLYQDFEKKETISVKEMPRKRTVLDRIALFEKRITAGPKGSESPVDLTPPSTTENFLSTTLKTEETTETQYATETTEIATENSQVTTETSQLATENTETTTDIATENLKQQKKDEDNKLRRKIEDLDRAKTKYGSIGVMPALKLSNGQEMPVLAIGTALLDEALLPHIIKAAIDLGYRAFDTAYIYGNEKAVGEAIRQKIDDGSVRRDQLFIINKLWSTFHRTDLVEKACRSSLETMGLEYFDLYLIHNPMSFKEGGDAIPKIANVMQYSESDYMDAWFGMEDVVTKGLAKSIGLSNFNSTQVMKVHEKSSIKPVINQVECHPYLTQYPLETICLDRNIQLSCFGVLGSKGTPTVLRDFKFAAIDDPLLITLAATLNMTTAQLLIRYQLDRHHQVVVKASSASHLWDNLQAINFRLNESNLISIDSLNRNKRTFSFQGMGDTHRNYPFKG